MKSSKVSIAQFPRGGYNYGAIHSNLDYMPLIEYEESHLSGSGTGATAFSPTDTMPFTHRAKFLMMAEAMLALILISFVVSRAINII